MVASTSWSQAGQVYGLIVDKLEAIAFPAAGVASLEDRLSWFSGDPDEAPDRDRVFTLTLDSAPTRFGLLEKGCAEKQLTLELNVQYVFTPPEANNARTAWETRAMGDQELIEDALDTMVGSSLTPLVGQITQLRHDAPPDTVYGSRALVIVKLFTVVYSRV